MLVQPLLAGKEKLLTATTRISMSHGCKLMTWLRILQRPTTKVYTVFRASSIWGTPHPMESTTKAVLGMRSCGRKEKTTKLTKVSTFFSAMTGINQYEFNQMPPLRAEEGISHMPHRHSFLSMTNWQKRKRVLSLKSSTSIRQPRRPVTESLQSQE